jgi:hypothetical protein
MVKLDGKHGETRWEGVVTDSRADQPRGQFGEEDKARVKDRLVPPPCAAL